MNKKIFSVALCLTAALTMTAQTVDKSKVTTSAVGGRRESMDV